MDAVKAISMTIVRRARLGLEVEDAIENGMQQPKPQDDGEQAKAQAQQQADAQKAQVEQQKIQAQAEAKDHELQMKASLEQQKMVIEAQAREHERMLDAAFEKFKALLEAQTASRDRRNLGRRNDRRSPSGRGKAGDQLMPIYQSKCGQCHEVQDYYQTINDRHVTPWCCGVQTEKVILRPAAVHGDLPAYQSPIDGKLVHGRKQRLEDMKRNGCRPWEGLDQEKKEAAKQEKYADQKLDASLTKTAAETFYQLPPSKRNILKGT
jgi:hypothetical protein